MKCRLLFEKDANESVQFVDIFQFSKDARFYGREDLFIFLDGFKSGWVLSDVSGGREVATVLLIYDQNGTWGGGKNVQGKRYLPFVNDYPIKRS